MFINCKLLLKLKFTDFYKASMWELMQLNCTTHLFLCTKKLLAKYKQKSTN